MTAKRLLIVDDETILCTSLKMDFSEDGYEVQTVHSGEEALSRIKDFTPSVILLDLRLPGMGGIEILQEINRCNPDIAVIIMTAFGDTQTIVKAVKAGAFHFINKPFELEELKERVKQALKEHGLKQEVIYLRHQNRKIYRYCNLVGQSRKMMDLYNQIDTLSQTDRTTVLIQGESGTGKELVASAIHFKSRRRRFPFMEINCASLPEPLIESELFGYEKGAFTDAKQAKKGLLEIADQGTVFLDEIAEMPMAIQSKLLLFLEKKKFKRLGSGKDIKVDVRIIAATNQDLGQAIENKAFRQDLYYRLNVVCLTPPPLRERKEDILPLANYFLHQFAQDMGKTAYTLSAEVETIFQSYAWPGNVRELRNAVERAMIFCKGSVIGKELLPNEMTMNAISGYPAKPGDKISQQTSIDQVLLQAEEDLIQNALAKTRGNKTQAADILGISRFSLNRRMNKIQNRE